MARNLRNTELELETIRLHKKDHTFYYKEALEKGVADKIVLNSIYETDLKSLEDISEIDIRGKDGVSLKVIQDEDLEDLEDKVTDMINKLSDEELELAITQFMQNKKNNLNKDNEQYL